MKRRAFLQQVGVALAAMGVSETGLWLLGDRYSQALAQTSPRKLALLVGINQYAQAPTLTGCLTDVELQQELLIYRFGFLPSDILVLTDQQATRQNIETAFREHLAQQAKPGDVVIFHFSGYGCSPSRSSELTEADVLKTQPSLVPVDGLLLSNNVPVANIILPETLWGLLRSLNTPQVTTVLDTSFAPGVSSRPGSLHLRSHPQLLAEQLSAEELAILEQLQQNSKLKTQVPGVILAASAANQVATEGQWNGFSAGLFTYILTQHLWQCTPASTIQISWSRVAGMVAQLAGEQQQPQLRGQSSTKQTLLPYHLLPNSNVGVEGVVIAVEDSGKGGYVWLAGLPITVLNSYGVNSLLTLLPPSSSETSQGEITSPPPLPQLQIRSREGLKAKVKIVPLNPPETYTLQIGQQVQEAVRVLPRNLGLTIGLDTSLERIERVDATSAIAVVPNVSVVIAGEQPADCLFGRVGGGQAAEPTRHKAEPLLNTGYGLFSLNGNLIPDTLGEPGEAIKTAVQRLIPKLHQQLATKLFRLSANEASSRLGVKATLEMVAPTPQVLIQRGTLRATWPIASNAVSVAEQKAGIVTVPMGSQIQYQLYNYSDRPLYLMLFGTDSSGNAIALFPPKSTASLDSAIANLAIAPQETLTIPDPSSSFSWILQNTPGLGENQIILSTAPFTHTLTTLATAKYPRPEAQKIGILEHPLEVAQAVLEDLHRASAGTLVPTTTASDTLALDVNAWATFTFIYQIL